MLFGIILKIYEKGNCNNMKIRKTEKGELQQLNDIYYAEGSVEFTMLLATW